MNHSRNRQRGYLSFSVFVLIGACVMMTGCSATGKTFTPSTEPEEANLLYICRTDRFLGSGTLLTAQGMPAQEMITTNVEASEVYFVKFDHAIEGPYMELADKGTGESEVQSLKMIDPSE